MLQCQYEKQSSKGFSERSTPLASYCLFEIAKQGGGSSACLQTACTECQLLFLVIALITRTRARGVNALMRFALLLYKINGFVVVVGCLP